MQNGQANKAVAVLVRVDFLAAVLLTVVAPLLLLARAVRHKQQALIGALLSYWRASSLLMVAVYLLIDKRWMGFVCGIVARLLIPYILLRNAISGDMWYTRWRRVVSTYCLIGATLNLPLLRCLRRKQLSPLCRAYIEPAQQFGEVVHPDVPPERLGRAGEIGLWAFVAGAVGVWVRRFAKLR
jgi:hypothetical protein